MAFRIAEDGRVERRDPILDGRKGYIRRPFSAARYFAGGYERALMRAADAPGRQPPCCPRAYS
ncbi:MAG: hypothetical protein L0Y50_04570 [Beijerinckiaceae bacterium]|nr:hypothetical protein [Beijerinckiaceae bacterium]MCI0735532.1 hypothetical protein [Beijerinckiaceae bacterium]